MNESLESQNSNIIKSFSIITVNYNNAPLLIDVVKKSHEALKDFSFEFIIVDNLSTDNSFQLLSKEFSSWESVLVYSSGQNGGFGFGCNFGAKQASSPILWFLNSDAWVESVSKLPEILEFSLNPDVGLIGTSVFTNSGVPTPQGGGDMSFAYFLLSAFRVGAIFRGINPIIKKRILNFLVGYKGVLGQYANSHFHADSSKRYKSFGVGGASFLVQKSKFQAQNGFDENFFLYDEDGDLCMRFLHSGFINYIDPDVKVFAYESATTSKLPSLSLKKIKLKSRVLFIEKHFNGFRRYTLLAVTYMTWWLL